LQQADLFLSGECRSRVKSRQTIAGQNPPLSAMVRKRTNAGAIGLSALCHKQTLYVVIEMKEPPTEAALFVFFR
jgi:hypothetical protein